MQTDELPKAQIMLEISEKSSVEGTAKTTRLNEPPNADDQLNPKNGSTAATSAEKNNVVRNESATTTPEYPVAWKLFAILAALCLAVFLVALDQTIVAVAVPKITDHFHSLDDVGWYVWHRFANSEYANISRYGSAYLLTRAALQPSFGRVYGQYDVCHLCHMLLCVC